MTVQDDARADGELFHRLLAEDAPVMAARRRASAAHKGEIAGPDARPGFDLLIEAVPPPASVRAKPGTVGGVEGWWCLPEAARPGLRLLFSHGGGYVLGSAAAFRNFAGHLAVRTGAETFVPNYRRAPEHPFPAAIDDILACYRGLAEEARTICLAGDSAGGGLTLALLSLLREEPSALLRPSAAAVISPWTDLSLSGESMRGRADADPIFTRDALSSLARLYLQGADPLDPRASPLGANLSGLPPIRIDVGEDEILLDDARRYGARAREAGSRVELHVWEGMSHVFPAAAGSIAAADTALDGIGAFLVAPIESRPGPATLRPAPGCRSLR